MNWYKSKPERVAVGRVSGPGVAQYKDRWGRPVESFEAIPWFWLDKATWEKLQWFQNPTPIPSGLDVVEALKDLNHPLHLEIKAKVAYAGMSLFKQMNVENVDGELIRIAVPMGLDKFDPCYRQWSLFERTIGYQLSKLKARRLTK